MVTFRRTPDVTEERDRVDSLGVRGSAEPERYGSEAAPRAGSPPDAGGGASEVRRPAGDHRRAAGHDHFFFADRRQDGTYDVTLTEEGVATFETALGVAHDLGRRSLISPYSTIADIMDRTATREELSEVMRSEERGPLRSARLAVLRRKLRGSERATAHQRTIGHIGKIIIVALFVFWTIQQFVIAVEDIAAIPGLLLHAPSDLLHPLAPLGQIGNNIADAGHHFIYGVVGTHLVYIVAALIRPFGRIYRKDQIIPGERFTVRSLNRALRRLQRGVPAAWSA